MKKTIFILTLISAIALAQNTNSINYETLANEKKIVMETIDTLKNLQMDMLIYDISSFSFTEYKSSGENILDEIEENNQSKSVALKNMVLANKNRYYLKNNINISKKTFLDGNSLEIGTNISYINAMLERNKINAVDLGIDLKTNIADYKLNILTSHNFNYTNIWYYRNFKQDYMAINGSILINANIGEKFFLEPGLRATYNYNLKSKLLDQNDDSIVLNPSINYSIGAYAKIGYNFGDENKYRISFMYGIDKKLNNVNNYEIFSKKLNMKAKNNISHDVEVRFEMQIKEQHNLIMSGGMKGNNFKGGITYKYSW